MEISKQFDRVPCDAASSCAEVVGDIVKMNAEIARTKAQIPGYGAIRMLLDMAIRNTGPDSEHTRATQREYDAAMDSWRTTNAEFVPAIFDSALLIDIMPNPCGRACPRFGQAIIEMPPMTPDDFPEGYTGPIPGYPPAN